MNGEPFFMPRASGDYLHHRSLIEYGGRDGIRDENAYESAINHPINVYSYSQGDMFDMAAAYAFHIAENQPFIEGNKRTGIAMALAFLQANGLETSVLKDDELYDAMIGIAEKRVDKAGLAAIFRQCIRLAP